MPELASKGGYRVVAIDVDLAFDVSADDARLPRVCYVTILLREYMKE